MAALTFCLAGVALADDLQPSAIRTVSAFRRGGWNTLPLGLRRSTSRPVRSRFEIIRRLDIGCVKGV
jgi:hypothetical protein